jgi:hypothetical protein
MLSVQGPNNSDSILQRYEACAKPAPVATATPTPTPTVTVTATPVPAEVPTK